MDSLRLLSTAGALLVLTTACGGRAAPAADPTAPPAAASSPAPLAGAPPAPTHASWSKDMAKEQKVAFMKGNVVPNMKPVFQSANATRYADFGCKTCHGPEFKLPRDFLPKLTMKDGKLTAFAEKPKIARFMAESVVPTMAGAMGLPPFDMKTGQGFGCAGCHTVDTK